MDGMKKIMTLIHSRLNIKDSFVFATIELAQENSEKEEKERRWNEKL